MEKLKITRRNRKGNLTRVLKELDCLVQNCADLEEVDKVIEKAKTRYESIEDCHDEIVDLIKDDVEYTKEQEWMSQCQGEYMAEIGRIKALIASKGTSTQNHGNSTDKQTEKQTDKVEATGGVVGDNLVGLFKAFSLPKNSVKKFDGDPLYYHVFMASFKSLVSDIPNDDVKLNTLMSLMSDKALEAIQHCVLKPSSEGYSAACETLKERFGNNAVIVQAWITKIKMRPKVDTAKLREFADDLRNCYEALSALGYLHELNNQSSLKVIVDKLPKFLQNRWQRENYKLKARGAIPSLTDVVEFVKASAVEVTDPVFGSSESHAPTSSGGHRKSQVHNVGSSHQATNQGNDHRHPKCWVCKSNEHWPDQCGKLIGMSVEDRFNLVKESHGCFACLKIAGRNHRMNNCTRKKQCGERVGGDVCDKMHHRLLHLRVNAGNTNQVCAGLDHSDEPLLSVLDVVVQAKSINLTASVLLDTGSQGTFVTSAFAQKMNLRGKSVSATVTKLGGATEEFPSKLYQLDLCGDDGRIHSITALEVSRINEVKEVDVRGLEKIFKLDTGTLKRRGGPVDILIGVDFVDLLTGETKQAEGLVAQKSPLGWTVFGNGGQQSTEYTVMHVKIGKPVDLTDFWSTEAMGVEVNCDCKTTPSAFEDDEAKLIQESCQKVGDRWLIPYLWAKDPVHLRDNRGQATKMLKGLENRLKKTSEYSDAYCQQMEEMVSMGFARKLEKAEIEEYEGPVHYIPHHAVVRADKKSTPVRIVFNASNKCNGESINDYWLKGPDLLNDLHGVILRFREQAVALCGDIGKMYHQVLIPEVDQHVHRYLWRNLDDSREPDTFVKTVLTFGDKPAAAMALTALKMTAKEGEASYPEAAKVVDKDSYMDDVCTSVKTVGEARKLASDIDAVLSKGGFKIKEWMSNKQLADEQNGDGIPLGSKEMEEKILGVKWDNVTDDLVVNVKLDSQITQERITKRRALGVIAKVFDPIGFVAPVVVKLKMKMQELWESGVDWDEHLPEQAEQEWRILIQDLLKINECKIPRCLTPMDATDRVSLVVFCDASEKAFGTCAYVRWELENGKFETRFVAAKSRVAPLKKLTVPRLELQAAVMGARMAASIEEETSFRFEHKIYMTDSMIVLGWIKRSTGGFKQFVATRVAEIQAKTRIEDWRHVPGILNPADDVSRGIQADDITGRWLQGPEFLSQPMSQWPNEKIEEVSDEREEKLLKFCGSIGVGGVSQDVNTEECQSWDEVLDLHRRKICGDNTAGPDADVVNVENHVYRQIQRECFKEEYELLKNAKTVPGSSRLANLDPQFDKDAEVIRVGGRLRKASGLDLDLHPIVLDPKHHVTKLIIRKVDEEVFHHSAGHEQVFAHVRRKFWILKGRSAVKSVLHDCTECRRWRKKPDVPVMADLPSARLRVGKPAFYSTGMDCFGPYMIKIGRRQEKRWGVIFKCMTTKAVHLELVGSMDADAFLMAFRRFVSRRGTPKELYSDCGTNFKGAEQELSECFRNMSKELQDKLAKQQVEFKFNPPSAPHFGGIWEREIKSVKNALRCCLKERVIPEAVLQTVITEVEALMNSKPLGYVSSDVADADPITPNNLLMGRRDPSLPTISFSPREEIQSKKQWRHSQVIVDVFWKRFVAEYLPNQQVRQKWLSGSPSLEQKDKVLVIDNQAPRGEWLVGEVVTVYPSEDGKVRVADVSVNGKVYKRPVIKLIKLEEFSD